MVLTVGFKVETAILALYCSCDTGFHNASVYLCSPCWQVDSGGSNYPLILILHQFLQYFFGSSQPFITQLKHPGTSLSHVFLNSFQGITCRRACSCKQHILIFLQLDNGLKRIFPKSAESCKTHSKCVRNILCVPFPCLSLYQ